MFCFNCGTELSKGAKYCAKCGSKAVNMSCMGNTVQLKCKSCDGTLFVDEEREILQCPYCGSSELLIESDEVTIERIKQKSKKAIEFKRLDTNKELELEKIYYKEKRQQRQNDQAWKDLPKVWGFLIVLIIGFVLFMDGLNLLAKIEGKVSAPGAATELVGKNYLVVEHQFEDAGFSDIRIVELDTKDASLYGTVSEVSIAGQSDFNSGMYKKDSIVRIFYYTE